MYIYIYNYIYVLYIYTRKGLSNAKKNTRHTSIMYAFHGQIGCTKQWLAGKQWPRNQCCAWWPLTTRSHSSRVITLDTEDPSSFQSWWSCCFGALQKNWKRTIGHWFVYPCGMVFGMVSITEEGFHLPCVSSFLVRHLSHHDDVIILCHLQWLAARQSLSRLNTPTYHLNENINLLVTNTNPSVRAEYTCNL